MIREDLGVLRPAPAGRGYVGRLPEGAPLPGLTNWISLVNQHVPHETRALDTATHEITYHITRNIPRIELYISSLSVHMVSLRCLCKWQRESPDVGDI